MKYLIILGDGMADYPIDSLGGKTPLMVANIPNIDELAKKGRSGMLQTIPKNLPPGSAVANLSVLGYDPGKYFQGRGVLEAANQGVKLKDNDLALRCNVICVEEEKIKNHSAGHISSQESHQLIAALNKNLATDRVCFYPGVGYRHILVISGGSPHISCTPPHDVPGTPFADVLVKAGNDDKAQETAELLNGLILKSRPLLENHPVNRDRQKQGKDMANTIWPWSPGNKPSMPTYRQLYGLSGAIISAVDLINGVGVYAGMSTVQVKGATGLYDTNYEGKAQAAVDALKTHDFVYLHIEASDEAGHEGDVNLKIKTIEYLDQRIVKNILKDLEQVQEPVAIAVLPDHPTPCRLRTHTYDPVPFLICNPDLSPDKVSAYDEISAKRGCYETLQGAEFIKTFFGR